MLNKIITATVITFALATIGFGQTSGSTAIDVKRTMAEALSDYLAISNALVASDHPKAQAAAGKLGETLAKINEATMSENDREQWSKFGPRLIEDAKHINKTGDLEHQREHFATLSNDMFAVITLFKANSKDIYQHYCPMKKTTWLSESKEVKNPYYGSKMLKCGSVRSTLKKNSNL